MTCTTWDVVIILAEYHLVVILLVLGGVAAGFTSGVRYERRRVRDIFRQWGA